MTTICCVKCPDCKCNPGPAQPSSLSLTDWPSPEALPDTPGATCHLGEGQWGSRTPGRFPVLKSNRYPPATSQEPKEHMLPAEPPTLVSGKQGGGPYRYNPQIARALLTNILQPA